LARSFGLARASRGTGGGALFVELVLGATLSRDRFLDDRHGAQGFGVDFAGLLFELR
jgi:hypothetical protein